MQRFSAAPPKNLIPATKNLTGTDTKTDWGGPQGWLEFTENDWDL